MILLVGALLGMLCTARATTPTTNSLVLEHRLGTAPWSNRDTILLDRSPSGHVQPKLTQGSQSLESAAFKKLLDSGGMYHIRVTFPDGRQSVASVPAVRDMLMLVLMLAIVLPDCI